MKANELRIGNRLQSGKYEIIVGPAFFTAFDNYDFENGKVGVLKPEIQPIPITEKPLLKFGFKLIDLTTHRVFDIAYNDRDNIVRTFRVIIVDNGVWFIIDRSVGDGTRMGINLGTFHYVHELQNLYFALTGKELISK